MLCVFIHVEVHIFFFSHWRDGCYVMLCRNNLSSNKFYCQCITFGSLQCVFSRLSPISLVPLGQRRRKTQ